MFTLEGLLAFHTWTQHSYRLLYEHAAGLTAAQLLQPLDGFGFATVRDQLVHIAMCEDAWVSRAKGLEFKRWDYTGFTDARAIYAAYEPAAQRTRDWLASLTPEELMTPRPIMFSPTEGITIAPAPMLHHILTHGYHHKGQVVAMCRLLGHPAPETDLDGAVIVDI
jgi:uncharacterized damage-inducible protein DinB